MSVCGACDSTATHVWQRQASEAEMIMFHADPNSGVLPGDTEAHVPVFACDAHTLSDDLASQIHRADCAAPAGPCGCYPVSP